MASGGLNAGSSLFHGSTSTTISGGEINSSAGDHNRLVSVVNIYQGTQPDSGNQSTLIPSSQNPLAPSGDPGQGPSDSPLNPGTQLRSSVAPRAHASTEEEEPPNARYERHMLVKKHGFPLWAPQPHSRLPLSYRRKGVSIGDVGVITEDGYFDFLFNICLPLGHTSNPPFLPINFSPVYLLPTDISELRQHDWGSCILTSSAKKQKGLLTFDCNGPEGSILVMPKGAYHEELLNVHKFKRTASQNAENWYRYAIGGCGRDIGNGELRLVTGCDKTSLWGIATYSDIRPGTLTLAANDVQSPVEYTWDYEGHVEAKAGPRLDESSDSAGSRNQCTFLRAYTVTLADDMWKTVVSTLVQDSSENYILNYPEPRSYFPSMVSGLFGVFGGRGGTVNVRNHGLGTEKSTVHPATVINQMLLSQYPNAKVAISHDDDWCAVIREDEITMPGASELLDRIRQTFIFHFDEDGTVYLSQEGDPEANPQRLGQPKNENIGIYYDIGTINQRDNRNAGPLWIEGAPRVPVGHNFQQPHQLPRHLGYSGELHHRSSQYPLPPAYAHGYYEAPPKGPYGDAAQASQYPPVVLPLNPRDEFLRASLEETGASDRPEKRRDSEGKRGGFTYGDEYDINEDAMVRGADVSDLAWRRDAGVKSSPNVAKGLRGSSSSPWSASTQGATPPSKGSNNPFTSKDKDRL